MTVQDTIEKKGVKGAKRSLQMAPEPTQLDTERDQVTRSTNGKYLGKTRLLSRNQLDQRTSAAQEFDAIAKALAVDLGGEDNLSTVQRFLIEAFAGCAVHVSHLNALLVLGKNLDVAEHSQVVSTMVRVASRIGVQRVPRDVSPTLSSILRDDLARQREEQREEEPPP